EGAILVVDASQGIQAQTLSNLFLAMDAGLEIIPILNKIDLPGAEPDRRAKEVADLLGYDSDHILRVSAKAGLGIDDLPERTRAGDTIFDAENHAQNALPGYREVRSFVFAGLYPTDTQQYEDLRDALEKLQLNDASLNYEPETSTALGFGFRCGFLGLLHMEIVQERLEREFDLDLVTTVPSVEYHVYMTDDTMQLIEHPSSPPDPGPIAR